MNKTKIHLPKRILMEREGHDKTNSVGEEEDIWDLLIVKIQRQLPRVG